MEIVYVVVPAITGLFLLLIGSLRLSNPIQNYSKNSGITLENDVNLLNEMRGVSALMLLGGVVILLGTVVPQLTTASFVVAILIYLGFAVGRLVSFAADGKPNKLIVKGFVFELVFGGANAFCLAATLA